MAEDPTVELLSKILKPRSKEILDSKIKTWSDKKIQTYLTGGKDGATRDSLVWRDVVLVAKEKKLKIIPLEEKYDFF